MSLDEKKTQLALECHRWVLAVQRDILENADGYKRLLTDKVVSLERVAEVILADQGEYLKTLAGVERMLDPEVHEILALFGVDILAEIASLKGTIAQNQNAPKSTDEDVHAACDAVLAEVQPAPDVLALKATLAR